MGSWYDVNCRITEFNPKKVKAIVSAARAEWDFEKIQLPDKHSSVLYLGGEDKTGVLEDRLRAVAQAVWKANEAYCELDIQSLYLEELPWENHVFDEDLYDMSKEG